MIQCENFAHKEFRTSTHFSSNIIAPVSIDIVLTINYVNPFGSAKVNVTGELADDHDIDALNDLPLESRGINKLVKDLGGAKVGEKAHLLPHFEKASLGPELSGVVVPLVAADAGKEDRVRSLALFKAFLGEWVAHSVDG